MFHSHEYIEFLQEIGKNWDDDTMVEKREEFGLGLQDIAVFLELG